MLANLKSLQNSQFLQAGFQKARISLSQTTFLEAGPRVKMSFMRTDKQVEIIEIFLSGESKEIVSDSGTISITVHEWNQAAFLDGVTITLDLDAKGNLDSLKWSHLFCYFDLKEDQEPAILPNPTHLNTSDSPWSQAVLVVFFLSEAHKIIMERGERSTWQVHFIDEQKSPNYFKAFLQQREPLLAYQVI